jgi:hypothetical protein
MDISRTHHADQAVHLTDLVRLKFVNQRFGTLRKRVVRLMSPDGPSTDGGRKARQSIVLMPEDGELGGAIVCGWLDVFRRVAELKTFHIVAAAFQDRYGMSIDISKTEYQRMLDMMLEFLRGLQIDARMAIAQRGRTIINDRPAPTPLPAIIKRPETSERLALIAGGALLGFSVCYALFALGVL